MCHEQDSLTVPKQGCNQLQCLNLLHPSMSMHILHTVFYTFPKMLTRRIFSQSRASLVCDPFLYSCDFNVGPRGDDVK